MTQDELLRHLAVALAGLGIRYFVTGSIATIYYGEPRFTNDIDVVVDLPERRIAEFRTWFPAEDFYLSEKSLRHAVRRHGAVNILHPASGLKLDIMIPETSLFNHSRFLRVKRLRPAEDLWAWRQSGGRYDVASRYEDPVAPPDMIPLLGDHAGARRSGAAIVFWVRDTRTRLDLLGGC